MKILLVSSFLPYPLFSGGHVRLYNLLKQLSQKHEITLVCEKRKNQTQVDIAEVKKVCKDVHVINRKKQWSPQVIFQTTISSYPFLLAGHDLPEMKAMIAKLLSERQFDIIHVETFYVMQNIPETTIPIVLTEHNIEHKVYQRFVDSAPFVLRPFLQIDVEKIKYWEKKFWHMATKVVAVSKIEAEQIRSDAVVVANGVDIISFPYKQLVVRSQNILFMGDFKWIQNRDTAVWIIKKIWPQIVRKEIGERLKLWIVGKHIPENIQQLRSEDIVIDEHAPDKTSDIYKKADVLLAPIRVGGGTSYKILEAMASGVPVVTTQLGIEGLQAEDGKEALIGTSSENLAQCVAKLLTDKTLYETIRKNARKCIEKNYTWQEIARVLEGVYHDAAKK